VLSVAQREAHIYPCVDPFAGRSRGLDPSVVGAEHVAVATRVHETLLAAARLEAAGAPVPPADAILVGRARRLRRFFGQPFFVAEAYTQRPGTRVPCAETVRACAAILDGAYDAIPESAFDFTGGIEDVLARAGR
jgi:F-type H+-transporting ATPase subunit beta